MFQSEARKARSLQLAQLDKNTGNLYTNSGTLPKMRAAL
jgi:hypothetical protein